MAASATQTSAIDPWGAEHETVMRPYRTYTRLWPQLLAQNSWDLPNFLGNRSVFCCNAQTWVDSWSGHWSSERPSQLEAFLEFSAPLPHSLAKRKRTRQTSMKTFSLDSTSESQPLSASLWSCFPCPKSMSALGIPDTFNRIWSLTHLTK